MKNKNILAMVLATSMLVPSNAYALSKSDFSDFPNDWSTPALTNAVENGLLVGANGKINGSSFITRAEISAIINRAFGAKKTTSISNYNDVPSNAWYHNDMAKAVHMGTFVGSGGYLNPEDQITREEVFSVIARAFLLDSTDTSQLSKFNDGSNVSDWAKSSVAVLVEKGYINGYNGNINPKSNITRAEFAQIMYMVAGSYISSSGEYSNNIKGNLVVSSDNVVLKNATIEGDLIIADGVDTGKIDLNSISVKGRIVIRGGSNINITGKTTTGDVIVQNKNSDTEINVDKDSSVGNILYKTETKITGEGKKGTITNQTGNIEKEEAPVTDKPSKPSGGGSSGGGGSSPTYTTHTVSNWKELKSAAKDAKSGDTIKLKDNITDAGSDTTVLDGVSSATLTISKKNITFDGNNKTITVAEGKTFCFDIDGLAGTTTGVAVKDLTIDGGSFSTKLGGAFFVEDGAEATFENVTFKNCKADSKSSVNGGGAIFINDHGQIPPKVTVKNCTFENNTVPSNDGSFTGRGGAIYANNFRATTPMVLTVTNSTFKNNCAAYGGAIAVDGIVDIKVTGCTFENNNSTVGGDDVYIYEGISSGKKNLSITSKVNATLSDNTYTNKSDSESNMNEMNVIFSRYYPSDFTGDMTTKAPEGAKDLTFKDIERTEVITADTEIPMNSISIEGKTYYYGVPVYVGGSLNTNFTVNGEKVTSEKIGDTNIYCYCSDKLTGDLYGTAEVPYADFYYGELNSVSEPSSNIVTKSDTAQSMRGEGLYDAVTSATTSKWGMYSNTFYEANSEADSTGGKILGVKTPIKLSADLYAKTIILKTVGVSCDNQLISIVDSIENLSSTPLNQFKTLYADGTLSAIDSSNSQVTTSSNVSATITDQTNYGNYQINVSDLPSEVNGRENIMGVIIETSDGAKYGLKHLENIWFRAGELAIASEEGISTHGNNISYERYKDIPGKTITKVTYILNGYKNLTIDNLNLYCGKLLGEEYSVTAENVQYSSNKEMPVKLTLNLPEGYEPKISLRKGRTDLTYDTDYTYNPENSTITIKNTENISPAVYTVIVSDNAENGYVSTKTTFTLNSSLSEKDIKFENNKLVITGDSGVTVDEYRNAITEIYVNDSSIRGAKGTSVINEDGSINFDAEASSHGSTTPIFPDGADGSYTLKLVATGYPTVTGTVGNGSVTPEPTEKLADGEWYGTGTWSLYYENKGPDIVRVIVENGVIKNAYSVKYTEDSGFERGQNILNNLTGLKNVDTIKEQLDNKEKGTAYDAVSGATMTAKGYLSAVENALERSMKFANDKKEQTVMWMDFSEFPKANMYFDENLDLTDVKLNVYISPNGEKKEIGFDQLADYGITTSIQNGTLITEDTPELSESNALQIDFIQEDSLISIPSKVVVSKKTNYTVPSHIVITFENGETQRLDIIEDEFNYEPKIIGSIKSMAIYDGDRKLTDGIYNEEYNDWEFSLKGIEPSESGQKWKFETYYIAVDSSEDTSNVKSFELDTNYLTTTYGVGYNLDLNDLNINIVTEKGSKQKLEGWQACLDRGFTAIPEDGYTFTEDDASASTKEIKISYGDLSKTFKVDVIDYEKQIPAKVKIYDGDSLVKTIDVNIEDWKDSNGMLTIYDIDMPEKYIDWSEDTFTLEVFNSSDDIISSEDYTISKYMSGKGMELHFSNYTEYDSYGGYLTFMFNYTGTTPPEPTNVTSEGSATVQDFGYDAKVSVTYNKDTGEIVSVADNGTDPGNVMNQSFWQSALAMFEKFVGKTAADIDSIDAVSGATLSSNAIKEAVKNALPSVSDTVDSPTVEAEDLRTQMLFAATEPAVLKISAPEETEVYYTTDGSNPTEDVGEKKN